MKFAFSSDTYPNKWWMQHTANADIAIHECFITPSDLVNKQKFTDFIYGGRVNYPEAVKKVYDDTNKEFGTNFPPPK